MTKERGQRLVKKGRRVHKPKILVAGYGAWAKAENNPAAQVVGELAKRTWTGCDVIGHVMPVNSDELAGHIDALLDTHRPDAWVGMGVSEAAIIQAEMVGINWRHFDVPDSSGARIHQSPIVPGGRWPTTRRCPTTGWSPP